MTDGQNILGDFLPLQGSSRLCTPIWVSPSRVKHGCQGFTMGLLEKVVKSQNIRPPLLSSSPQCSWQAEQEGSKTGLTFANSRKAFTEEGKGVLKAHRRAELLASAPKRAPCTQVMVKQP